MSLHDAASQGRAAALARLKLAFPAPTHPTVKGSPVLTSNERTTPPAPPPPLSQETLTRVFNVQEQGRTRLEPGKKVAEDLCTTCRKTKHYGPCLKPTRTRAEGASLKKEAYTMAEMLLAAPLLSGASGALSGAAAADPGHRWAGAGSGALAGAATGIPASLLGVHLTGGHIVGPVGLSALTGAGAGYFAGRTNKEADFNLGLTGSDPEMVTDSQPSTSPNYSSATSDSSLARARDGRPADEQAATGFADLFRHLGITSVPDQALNNTNGLNKTALEELLGSQIHVPTDRRGPTANPYDEMLPPMKAPIVGWGDEGPQRIERAFDQIDGAVDSTNIEGGGSQPSTGPAVLG